MYLNRRALPQANRITKVRMCASLLGVDLHEPEFVPDAVDQVCEAVNVQCRQGGQRVASVEKGKDGDGDRDCDYDYDWLALVKMKSSRNSRHAPSKKEYSLEIHLTADNERVGLASDFIHLFEADGVDFVVHVCMKMI